MNGHRYRVIWRKSVTEYRIAQFMVDLIGRGESTEPLYRAMNLIDELLAIDPNHQGESRSEGERVLYEPPLCVTYEVHDDEQLVIVLRARYVLPRRRRG